MSSSYLATLRGNRLEWREPPPEDLTEDKAVAVEVTILSESAVAAERQNQGERMAAALSELASSAGERLSQEIPDPAVWQRETRSDRSLPGREP